MFVIGVKDYDRNGKELKTAMYAGKVFADGEIRMSKTGKRYGVISIPAFNHKDGTTAWITAKSFENGNADKIASLRKGDTVLVTGRVESRDYNGKTYTDLMAEIVITGRKIGTIPPPNTLRSNPGEIREETDYDESDLPF